MDQNEYKTSIGDPGQYPFTRGVYSSMYTGRLWTMRQYAGYSTSEETNRRYKYLIERGQTGLSVAFDLPTQMGYDSSDSMSTGEVGKSGVAIDTLDDMKTLFDGIPLDQVSISMTINASAPVILAMLIVTAEEQGVPVSALTGTVQNDILKEFIARGCYIYPPKPSLKLSVDIMEHCLTHVPKWNYISISGYHIREAGSTAAQELGFTLANAICYVDAAIERGVNRVDLGRRLSFFFNAHNNFLEEIAKYRAARRMWARIMKERFAVEDAKAQMLRFHVQTAGSSLTAQQVENNVVRVTLQGMAAVLGGTQSLHTNGMDEALSLPTEKSARIALRTQQILAMETGLPDIVDPFAGSDLIESMTNAIEAEALSYIESIDQMGGALKAIDDKYYQTEIEKSALAYQRSIEENERIIVGVNGYQEDDNDKTSLAVQSYLKIDEEAQRAQRQKLSDVRSKRNDADVDRFLEQIRLCAREDRNIMESVIEAVKGYCTLGEICSALSDVYGQYRPVH